MKNNKFNKKVVQLNNQHIIILILCSFAFLLIFLRLFFLQVINNQTFKKMSDQNRIRLIATEPIRGKILDKNGELLASSKLEYSLIIKPQFLTETKWQEYKYSLANFLNLEIICLKEKPNTLQSLAFRILIPQERIASAESTKNGLN